MHCVTPVPSFHSRISDHRIFFTARIQRMGKVMFSVCPPPGVGGRMEVPSPRFFGLWSQVLSLGGLGRGTPVPGTFPGLWSQVLSGGVPVPDGGGAYPSPSLRRGGGTPGQGTHQPGLGFPLPYLALGYPLGGMPLAVTQEDFLVKHVKSIMEKKNHVPSWEKCRIYSNNHRSITSCRTKFDNFEDLGRSYIR